MLDVIIAGAGAAGLSAALTAQEQGLSYLVLEQRSLASTVAKMPKRKRIFNTPLKLPLRGRLWFSDTTREELLDRWQAIMQQSALHVCELEGVLDIARRGETFHIKSDKQTYEARRVVLAIGAKGNPRKLGVAGEEESPKVFYWLSDPDAYVDQDILVVGGGDSAIEAALVLSQRNRVHLSYRRADFFRIRHRNASAIDSSIREGCITVHFNSRVSHIDGAHVELAVGDEVRRIPNDVVFALIGAEPPYSFLERLGVDFTDQDGQRVPRLSEHFETTVPGLYLVGAAAGRPLMKRAINQGYDVALHIARELHGGVTTIAEIGDDFPPRRLAQVEVNLATCNGCGVCEAACPQVFTVVDDQSVVDHSQVGVISPIVGSPHDFVHQVDSRGPAGSTGRKGPARAWERVRHLWHEMRRADAAVRLQALVSMPWGHFQPRLLTGSPWERSPR